MAAAVYAMRLADMEHLEVLAFIGALGSSEPPQTYRADLEAALTGVELADFDDSNVISLADWVGSANRTLETSQ